MKGVIIVLLFFCFINANADSGREGVYIATQLICRTNAMEISTVCVVHDALDEMGSSKYRFAKEYFQDNRRPEYHYMQYASIARNKYRGLYFQREGELLRCIIAKHNTCRLDSSGVILKVYLLGVE